MAHFQPQSRSRSAPLSWGDWPPTPERIAAAVAKAAPKVRAVIARMWPGQDVAVRVVVRTPEDLDLVYCPGTQFSPASESATAGEIRVVGKGIKWVVFWNPATEGGHAQRQFDYRV